MSQDPFLYLGSNSNLVSKMVYFPPSVAHENTSRSSCNTCKNL